MSATVEHLVRTLEPEVVGLSVMTFQRRTARRVAAIVRRLRPSATIVAGGYDPSLASEVYEDPSWPVDVIVKGEGDITFRELIRALEKVTGSWSHTAESYRRLQLPGAVRWLGLVPDL